VGFQEIVELSPQQILDSDPKRKKLWEASVGRCLNSHAQSVGGEKYVLLRSGQLVGAALCIFVKSSALPKIKHVEGSVKKTGMSGMAGNKGAVAIRLDYANTQFCFVTAHLAAGFANYEERNKDYSTIHHGLRFQRNRGIDDHDTVIWLGDFNYRIGLSREKAIDLVNRRDLGRLYENDQLNLQMVAGLAFPFYSEARITFLPTYRYVVGSDEFDSSEKQRIPAWTDRILRKGSNIRQTSYNSAPLRFSDHRPVYATFECTVSIVDEALRDKISRGIYTQRKQEVGHGTANVDTEDTDDEDLIGYDAIEPGLPPASSDRHKWWLENGKMARSTAMPPKSNGPGQSTILNPNRPSNPFTPTSEPDWVAVPSRSESRLSSFSSMSSSPYEHVNHSMVLSTSASSQPPRKLPPPFDPSAPPVRIGKTIGSDDLTYGGRPTKQETPPPPPPTRRQGAGAGVPTTRDAPMGASPAPTAPQAIRASTMPAVGGAKSAKPGQKVAPTPPPPRPASRASTSSQSTTKTKGPPPVARKPAHLTAVSPASSPKPEQMADHAAAPRPVSPGRASVSLRDVAARYAVHADQLANSKSQDTTTPPRLPRRTTTDSNAAAARKGPPAGAVALPGMSGQDGRPGLPPRKPTLQPNAPIPPSPWTASTHPVVKQKGAVDLLGDEAADGGSMSGWETLKPT